MEKLKLEQYVVMANSGDEKYIGKIMQRLNKDVTLQETREIDYALSKINNPKSIEMIKLFLFEGTQIQRNYAALYFGRLHEYLILREAYDLGLIDEIQAFSR